MRNWEKDQWKEEKELGRQLVGEMWKDLRRSEKGRKDYEKLGERPMERRKRMGEVACRRDVERFKCQ